jgi:hypothetical protein
MKTITAEEFDRKFDDGEDISAYVDWSKGVHPNRDLCPVSLELPQWLVNAINERAEKLGQTSSDLMRRWLEEALLQQAGDQADGRRDVAE